MILSYKYRLLPTKRQHAALAEICESQRHLYNAALEERIDCYRKTGKSLSYISQAMALKECRRALPDMAALPANLQRGTLKRLDAAFQGFFSRLKVGGKPGFPRFRGRDWFNSFEFAEFSGITFDAKRIRFKGLPSGLRVHLHRQLPSGKICSAKFKRDQRGWSVSFQIRIESAEKVAIRNAVGLDLGLKTLAHLSDGLIIPNPRVARRAEKELRIRSRALARCKRGSQRRRKIKARATTLHRDIVNARTTYLHQQSAMLVKTYDLIAVEDLKVANMVQHPTLARAISDVSWSTFINMISYKAEKAGRYLIKVDPKFTSQDCSGCGERVPKTLAVRTHSCFACGTVLDRDHNAALNVLHRGVLAARELNVVGYDVRALGNLNSKGISN